MPRFIGSMGEGGIPAGGGLKTLFVGVRGL